MPSPTKKLIVGKTHQTQTKGSFSSPELLTETPISQNDDAKSSSTSSKMTHRQQYEALLAATTRPPPHILSSGLAVGGIVRSDPISGKVSKGFWGPGRDANFHLRPHIDHTAPPSAIFLLPRQQTHALWGLLSGFCVHTRILSRHHATHGGRASSLNATCESALAHEGEILDIWAPEVSSDDTRWVTAGADGKVKYWQLNPGESSKSGKRLPPAEEAIPGSITCLFASNAVGTSLPNRSDAVKRRQTGAPDGIILARCDIEHDVVCGVTEDGDLRIWFDAQQANAREVRVDVGAAEELGAVKRLELNVQLLPTGVVASILVHHSHAPTIARYDIADTKDAESAIAFRLFATPEDVGITVLQTQLIPTPPISTSPHPLPASFAGVPSHAGSPGVSSFPPLDFPPSDNAPHTASRFGRFIAAGDQNGTMWMWAWDGEAKDGPVKPLRAWPAMSGKITAIDVSCGLVAVGSYDGYIKIFDHFPTPPILLRTFHASHLSPADALVAASTDSDALYYIVNQIILENDLVVASIGRKIFAWRAGTGKGRQDAKGGDKRRASGGRGEFKGNGRTLDMKSLHQDAADLHSEIRDHNAATRVPSRHERQHIAAMEDLGLEDGDDAVQYALMLSMEEQQARPSCDEGEERAEDDDEAEAVRTVEAFRRAEEDEMREMMAMISRAEETQKN